MTPTTSSTATPTSDPSQGRSRRMAKVIGVHEIDLGEGADPAEFEQLAAAAAGEPLPSGMNVQVFKGDRGPRDGRYLMLIEIDSVEDRDRYFPDEDSPDD